MSTKTTAQKLALKPGAKLWISDEEHASRIGPLPDSVDQTDDLLEATAAIAFVKDAATARGVLEAHASRLAEINPVWIAYPKGNTTDINRDSLWPIVGEFGMRPNGQVAVDDVWSALRFRALKEGEAPFTGGEKP
jgi:hypothetical protein